MSYQEQGGSESVVVNGTVEGVEIKPNGRFVVKVREIGSTSQYALNLNTKEQNLAQQMMGSIGQGFSFICGLSHWTNQSGQPVTSKWINGVAPLQGGVQQPQPQPQQQPQPQWSGAASQAQSWQDIQTIGQQSSQPAPSQPAPQPQQQEVTDDAFIRRVSWLAAVPAAVAALEYLPEDQRTVPALVKMTDFLAQTAIIRGQRGFDGNPGHTQQTAQQMAGQEAHSPGADSYYGDPGPEQGDPGADDDSIPF